MNDKRSAVEPRKTVLVTAGYGNQARAAVPRLTAAGFHVRAMRRVDRPGPGPNELGAREVVIGDACSASDAYAAMDGVDAVYHVGPSFHPRELEMGLNMIDQAKCAGVKHFVFSSVLHPTLSGLPQHTIKRDIEERLLESGLNFTILQPSDYMQMTALGMVPAQNLFLLGWDLEKRQALIDLDDVAEVLVKVLNEGAPHFGATYELSSENLSGNEIAQCLSRVFGRPFGAVRFQHTYDPIPEIFGHYDEAHSRHQMHVFRIVNEWYDQHDFIGNSSVLRMLLGRNPTSLADFVRKRFDSRP